METLLYYSHTNTTNETDYIFSSSNPNTNTHTSPSITKHPLSFPFLSFLLSLSLSFFLSFFLSLYTYIYIQSTLIFLHPFIYSPTHCPHQFFPVSPNYRLFLFLYSSSQPLFFMDQSRVTKFEYIEFARKKKRTQPSRPPKPITQPVPDRSPISSTPLSDDTGKVSSDDVGDANSGGKMSNLSLCVARSLPVNGTENGPSSLPSNYGTSGYGMGRDNKLKKVKLKVGGVTRTIQAKSSINNGASGSGSSSRTVQTFDNPRPRKRPISQENSDEFHSPTLDKKTGLKGIPWTDFSKGGFSIGREDMGRKSAPEKQGGKSDSARKSKRAPKRRALDKDFDEDDEDDEIRYLEKLKTSKMAGYKELDVDSTRKAQKEDVGGNHNARKPKSGHIDYELSSEGEGHKKKKLKDSSELAAENKRELALTTRQRALLSKEGHSNQIEFPNGLPPAPPRKQKEKLTEVEQQLKKAEAAQRRRMQNEKAARESEAEAIRKILGQDSSRKKREEKIKKRQEEMAQEKATNNEMLATSTIRTVMGPTGTTVTFPRDMGFPKLFDPKPNSYPPPREKCAGPSCINPYKYRDSKSKLPLCSLQCYKAINGNMETEKSKTETQRN